MKKSVLFGLLLFVCFGIYGMEVEGENKPFPFDQLPEELQCTIARIALPDQMPIAPKDAIQDVAEYAWSDWFEKSPRGVVRCEKEIKGVDSKTRNALAKYQNGPRGYCTVVFSDRVVFGGGFGEIRICNKHTAELLAHYVHCVDKPAYAVAVSPDCTRVVSGGSDGKVNIANADTGEVLIKYGHPGVLTVAVSPDSRRVVSAGCGGTVKVASLDSGEPLAECAQGFALAVAVFLDNERVVSSVYDTKVTMRSIVPGLLAKHTLEKPNLNRYSFLKEVQERLLKEKKPLFIKQSKRMLLQEMPELKELLKIEKSKTNPIWCLQMKYAPDADTGDDGKSEK